MINFIITYLTPLETLYFTASNLMQALGGNWRTPHH